MSLPCAFGSATSGHVLLILDVLIPRASPWSTLNRRKIKVLVASDGVVDARPTSRLELIIVRLAKGKAVQRCTKEVTGAFSYSITYSTQMHSEDGSPLPVDCKLRLILHFPSFLPFPVLHSSWNGLFGDSFVAACVYHLARARHAQRKFDRFDPWKEKIQ